MHEFVCLFSSVRCQSVKLELFGAAEAEKLLSFSHSSIRILFIYLSAQGLCKLCTVRGFPFFSFFFLYNFLFLSEPVCLMLFLSFFSHTFSGRQGHIQEEVVALGRLVGCSPESRKGTV